MGSQDLRIYTCTPISFKGDHTFFSRESGLLSRGLRAIGLESYAVMPLPEHHGDEDGLIRAPIEELQRKSWWCRCSIVALDSDNVPLCSGWPKRTEAWRKVKHRMPLRRPSYKKLLRGMRTSATLGKLLPNGLVTCDQAKAPDA